ncbi:MAG: hypothetical protein EOO50_10135 [Flavobacterium sp.]|uniref:hypothetical protein n=1 Tax=Flavobacterium sp. TaxID=239 RepID=UPI00120DAD85|nr:hypothetical protein [Flavobacterium sp.]RZJ66281.1 MAG: hypothetical protein EOO50_10135 [Flavobacterium sp.]
MNTKKILTVCLFSIVLLSAILLTMALRMGTIASYEKLANSHVNRVASKLQDKESIAYTMRLGEVDKKNFKKNVDASIASGVIAFLALFLLIQEIKSKK